jgi:type 1 glutamine amidotransferase
MNLNSNRHPIWRTGRPLFPSFLAIAAILAVFALSPLIHAANSYPWKSLFNGRDLQGWEINKFAGAGEVKIEDGKIIVGGGVALTGFRRTNDFLRMNYEVEVQAMKLDGDDFFCGLTFPVHDANATLIVGGWGGSLVGVSSIDSQDASENEFTQYMKFDNKKWYTIRLRVTETKIQAWIDGEKMIDAGIAGRRISMRPGEIEDSTPFGIATYQTTAAIRAIKIRSIPAHIPRIAFIAGKKSHGPGEHEYKKALQLLQTRLEQRVEFIDTKLYFDGWPTDDESLNDADTIVLYCDGSDHGVTNYPLLLGQRLDLVGKLMDRGVGLVCLHYAVFVPKAQAGPQFLNWLGGYFNYESGEGPNHWYSKIELRDYQIYPATPEHPICQGIKPFSINEEFYSNIRFPEDKKNLTPIVTFDPDKQDWRKVVGWVIQQPNGHRGFAYTGGHYLKNFENPQVQSLLLNGILWTAHAETALSKKQAGE